MANDFMYMTTWAQAILLLCLSTLLGSSSASAADQRDGSSAAAINDDLNQDGSDLTPADGDWTVEDVVRLLSDGNFAARQQGMLYLWRHRDECRRLVEVASRHPDAEVADRSRWILWKWLTGVVAETPESILKQIRDDGWSNLRVLLSTGEYSLALVAIEEAVRIRDAADGNPLGRQPPDRLIPRRGPVRPVLASEFLSASESILNQATTELTARFSLHARRASRNGTLDALLRMVDLLAESTSLAICRYELMTLMGLPVDDASLLPATNVRWTPDQRLRTEAVLESIRGNHQRAIAAAEHLGDRDLVQRCQLQAGDWDAMQTYFEAALQAPDSVTADTVRDWCGVLSAASRSGDDSARRRAVDWLAKFDVDDFDENLLPAIERDKVVALQWRALAVHGEIEAAVAVVRKTQVSVAAELALAAGRAELAFEILGYPAAELDDAVDRRVTELIERRLNDGQQEFDDEVRNLFTLINLLSSVGRQDMALGVARRLAYSGLKIKGFDIRLYLLYFLRNDNVACVRELAVLPGEDSISNEYEAYLCETLPDVSSTMFKTMMNAVLKLMPNLTFRRRIQVVTTLLAGEVPYEFNVDSDYERLKEIFTGANASLLDTPGRVIMVPRDETALKFAEMMRLHGQYEIRREILEQVVAKGNLDALLEMADVEFDGGDSTRAELLYTQLIDKVHERAAYTKGRTDEYVLQAMASLWMLAKRDNDYERAGQLERELRLACCTTNMTSRRSVAWLLYQRGYHDIARQMYLHLFDIGNPVPNTLDGYSAGYSLARIFGDENPVVASDRAWRGLYSVLEDVNPATKFFVLQPVASLSLSVRAALETEPLTAESRQMVKRLVEGVLRLDQLEINFAEQVLPEIRQWGFPELADRTLDEIVDHGAEHARRFSRDAMNCNNVAWAASINGRRLDDALALSEQAVRLEPDSATYRDTLAEVLYRLGRVDEAIHVERACLLDDPAMWHLHEQIDRFESERP